MSEHFGAIQVGRSTQVFNASKSSLAFSSIPDMNVSSPEMEMAQALSISSWHLIAKAKDGANWQVHDQTLSINKHENAAVRRIFLLPWQSAALLVNLRLRDGCDGTPKEIHSKLTTANGCPLADLGDLQLWLVILRC